jgi:hypothetical protein
MPLEMEVAEKNKELTELDIANAKEYRASVIFSIDDNEDPVTYVHMSICENSHGSRVDSDTGSGKI